MNHYISGQLRLFSFLAFIALYFLVINVSGNRINTSISGAESPTITLGMK